MLVAKGEACLSRAACGGGVPSLPVSAGINRHGGEDEKVRVVGVATHRDLELGVGDPQGSSEA